jgi:extradiol dioxygenase family protein
VKPQFAFVAYPVSDISVSRRFYDTVLAVEPRATSDDWLEYDLGESAFVITQADADHGVPVRGALAAFEVADLDAEVARLRGHSVTFRGDIVETPVCRFIVVLDPDESEFLIHQRTPNAGTTDDLTRRCS